MIEPNTLEHFAITVYVILLIVDACYAILHDQEYFKETRSRSRVFIESQFWSISGIFVIYCFLKALTLFFSIVLYF